jgi:hypothetical protein
MNFEMIKRNFNKGLWNIDMVRVAVKKGIITKEQFQEITGVEYSI